MIAETISHYYIIKKLGEGGMGEVYLAEDTRLQRQVALKFLPASYQYDPDRHARFLKEARATSALRSPNIAAIYDIGEHEGSIFIVMEYVDGEMLSARLGRGPIPVNQTIEIALQIADALDEAHALGIVHCDIKSSNLMVNERGLVKILDFGIAKVAGAEEEPDSDSTEEAGRETAFGVVFGTASYMSPEQAMGKSLDSRSDLFSLGVVLYEMLTGRLPFEAANSLETINKITHQEPLPVTRLNYAVPVGLERIVRKCLEKDRERRYQSARELLIDLRALKREQDSGTETVMRPGHMTQPLRKPRSRRAVDSIAILPFANASGDPDTDYLSDGITESIINNLSQLPKLRVMARSTVFRYKGRDVDPQEVGRELNVRAVLMGRLLQRGETLVIKAELVDSNDGAHLWGDNYNRKLSDIFAIEEEISREISEKLWLKLNGEQKRRLARRYTDDMAAYQLYLKGRYYWNKRTEEDLKKGIDHFQRAIEIDPNYALAYSGLADSYVILSGYATLLPLDAFTMAKLVATKALELDETLAEAHTSLGSIKAWGEWDRAGAEKEYRRAIELSPGYSTAYQWYALNLISTGRVLEATAMIKLAQELDPLSMIINLNVARILYFAREYDESLEQCLKVLELYPEFPLGLRRLGQIYTQKKMYEAAEAALLKALAVAPNDSETMSALSFNYAMWGKRDRAEQVLAKVETLPGTAYVSPYSMARMYMGLGRSDQALEWLEKTCAERHSILVYLNVEPQFEPLHDDPRFQALLKKLGLV